MREGRVLVNGQPAREPGTQIDPSQDDVVVDGRLVERAARRTVALHKPPGYVCSQARQTPHQRLVGELLPAAWRDLYPIGRLDRDSEGLLLLTNDGELCLRLTHPRYGVTKHYRATVLGKIAPPHLKGLCAGLRDEGDLLRARRVRLLAANASHSVVELELAEGKRHEIRRLFAALGFEVERLERLQIGPIKLGELRPGRWRVLTAAELDALHRTTAGHTSFEPEGAGGARLLPSRPARDRGPARRQPRPTRPTAAGRGWQATDSVPAPGVDTPGGEASTAADA